MIAAVYHGVGDVRVEHVDEPEPAPGQLLIRVATAGICGTDGQEFARGPMFVPIDRRHPHSSHVGPTILGHEFSGWVVAAGSGVDRFAVGDLVACGAGVWCGRCSACARGATNLCDRYWTVGLHADGGLAEMVAVPALCCLDIGGLGLTPDLAALCQPMAIAAHAVRRGRVGAGDVALVLGVGGIGSFIVSVASAAGAEVVAVDLEPARLEAARRLGAAETRLAADTLDGDLDALPTPNVVFECTARPESLRRAVERVSQGGRVVVVGHQAAPVAVDFKAISMGEREVVGTMAHAFDPDFLTAADLLRKDPESWRSVAPRVFPLASVVETGLVPLAEGSSPQIRMLFDPNADTTRPLRTG